MADTVVNYVLRVDANSAKKGLDTTSREAKQTSEDFEKLSTNANRASASLDRVGRTSKAATSSARNLRRAGRDLDGAFGDLAQGLSIVNPALGSTLMTISDGASIVEGLGRSMTLFLNPAFAVAATVAIGAGLALFEFQREAEAAKAEAERLEKILTDTTAALEEQQNIIDSASQSLMSYAEDLESAKTALGLLTGELTQYQNEIANAERASAEFAAGSKGAIQEQISATEESIRLRQKEIVALRQKVAGMKEERKLSEPSAIMRAAGAETEFGAETTVEKSARNRLSLAIEEQKIAKENLQTLRQDKAVVDNRAKAYEETLVAAAKVREENRRNAEAEKRQRKQEAAERKLDAEFEKKYREQEQKDQKAYQERLKKAQQAEDARAQLKALALSTETNERDKILGTLQREIKSVQDLAALSGDRTAGEEIIANLRKKAAEDLKKLNEEELEALRKKKEEEEKITAERRRQISLLEIGSALNDVSKMSLSEILDSLREQVAELRERFSLQKAINEAVTKEFDARETGSNIASGAATLATGSVADIASLVNPLLGGFVSFLGDVGSKTPAERREELALQVEAVKNGLAFLPEIFLQVVPQLAIGLLEAFVDGFQLFFRNLRQVFEDFFSFRDRSPEQRQNRKEARQRAIADFFDPDKTASFMSGGTFLPKAAGGIRYTGNEQGLAMLHRGEYVVPASGQRNQNADRQLASAGSGVNVVINSAIVDRNAIDSLVREMEIRFNNKFGVSSSNLFGGR
jgi:hypothetical protein